MRSRIGEIGLISDDARRIVCFEENRREYRAENSMERRTLCYRIDGEVIQSGERCDYAMGFPIYGVVCLIELKGNDLKKAVKQLLSTLNILRDKIEPYIVHCRVVLSRVSRPDIRSSNHIRLERMLSQRGGTLRQSTKTMIENIETFNHSP